MRSVKYATKSKGFATNAKVLFRLFMSLWVPCQASPWLTGVQLIIKQQIPTTYEKNL
jgi:hypothetical protein